ncbi:MAG: hypothetical protein HFJ50_01615 [Clostridia bacterium]|jgi:hypothetical protein|nr:hypothetical protein [Clostridia bacterium]
MGSILNCGIKSGSITAVRNAKTSGSAWMVVRCGGISGTTTGYISDCYNKATITATNQNTLLSSSDSGGISGNGGKITNCYSTRKCICNWICCNVWRISSEKMEQLIIIQKIHIRLELQLHMVIKNLWQE